VTSDNIELDSHAAADSLAASTLARPFVWYGALATLYALCRIGSFTNIGDRVSDTPTYEHVAHSALWSSGFWTGERGFTIPLFFKIFQSTESRIIAQLLLSTIAWIVLAAAVARCMRHSTLRPLAFAVVLAFSLTTEIILWDTLLLSESVTFALCALLIAAWLQLVRSPSWLWVGTVLLLSLLWVFARDTNAYVLLVVGAMVALSILRGEHRRLKVVLALGCSIIFVLDYGSAQAGRRWLLPMENIVSYRVLPDPSMRAFFVARGFDPNSNWPIGRWMSNRSETVYGAYLLEHPGHTLFQPFYGHQRALYSSGSNAASLIDPNLSIYDDNASHRFLALPAGLDRILFPRGIAVVLALLAVLLMAGALIWRFLGLTSAWLVPVGILATTYPHFIVTWQQSGVEVDRHALEAAMLLRLAGFILALLFADRVVTYAKKDRAPAVGTKGSENRSPPGSAGP